jgi:hypothetical protein
MSIKTAAFAFLFLTATLAAQVKVSAITGTVTDQQNNRIPLARVRATHSATVLQRETQTTHRVRMRFPICLQGYTWSSSPNGILEF